MSEDKTGEARQGLVTSLTGKAKEVAGAVIGDDSLISEGQLQQTQARAIREAGITQAVADAEAEAAEGRIATEQQKAALERAAINRDATSARVSAEARARAQSSAAQSAAAAQLRITSSDAEREGDRQRVLAAQQADADHREAAREQSAAVADYEHAMVSAEADQKAADRARAEADRLAGDAEID